MATTFWHYAKCSCLVEVLGQFGGPVAIYLVAGEAIKSRPQPRIFVQAAKQAVLSRKLVLIQVGLVVYRARHV